MSAAAVYVGLGSNQGDRLAHLRQAARALAEHPDFTLTALSGVWETEYVGPGSQAPYLNACAALRTALGPAAVVAALKVLEAAAGRAPDGHLQPRPLDLDLLLWGDFHGQDGPITVPHPRARERAFVLEPLAQIAPEARFPDSGETVAAACANIRRKRDPWVRLWEGGALTPVRRDDGKEERGAALAVHRR
ncbi:MAG: 2-amino-4-hydroxy-6-hydroxymethyldihydropteridine diphosphokinase [Candidatus Krumholzibacteriia bacterium]